MTDSGYLKTYQHATLAEADGTLNQFLDLIVEGTWDWNAETGRVIRSPGWYRLLGYEVGCFNEDVLTWENLIHPEDYPQVMQLFERCLAGRDPDYMAEYRCRMLNGDYLWIRDRGRVVSRHADGRVARMIGAHESIQEQKVAEIELRQQNQLLREGNLTLEAVIRHKAWELERKNRELEEKIREIERVSSTDPLTGLANRRAFEKELNREIARANRYGMPLSLVLFDIDFFKRVNDNHGHKVGDLVLQQVASQVQSHIRDTDLLARWGGEEFVLILPGQSLQAAGATCEKLRLLISQHEFGEHLFITCSFGVTEYLQPDTLSQLFSRIDRALYQAKDAGRNCCVACLGDHLTAPVLPELQQLDC